MNAQNLANNTIKGSTTVNGVVYEYNEDIYGTNRGISIWRKGVSNDKHSYKLNPNPHDDPWYNKHQERFYLDLANEIGESTNLNRHYPPFNSPVIVHNINYSLEQP